MLKADIFKQFHISYDYKLMMYNKWVDLNFGKQ